MKKTILFYYATFLLLSVFLLGCGGWFAHKNEQANNHKTSENSSTNLSNGKKHTMPIDSLIRRKEDSGGGYVRYYFDTSKLKYFPDLNRATVFTKPEYKALFGWNDDYTVQSTILYYKGVPYDGPGAVSSAMQGKLISAQGIKFIPLAEPSDVKISPEQAVELALEGDFPTKKEEFRAKYMDSLGYVPPRMDSLLKEPPFDYKYYGYLPNAKFAWEVIGSEQMSPKMSRYYPKPKLVYLPTTTPECPLVYIFDLPTIRSSWTAQVDAVSGKVTRYRMDNHFTCDSSTPVSYTPDYLYYNSTISPEQHIPISTCSYGLCTKYSLSSVNIPPLTPPSEAVGQIEAFCRQGGFEGPPITASTIEPPRKSFTDWTINGTVIGNGHFSPIISLSSLTLPTTNNSTDGSATFNISSTTGISYTYSGSQILSTNSLVASTTGTLTSGTSASNLSAGMYETTLTDNNGCTYIEYIAMGVEGRPSITATISEPADCYNNTGNIQILVDNVSSFGGQLPQIMIKGAFNTAGFVAPSIFNIEDNKYKIDLKQYTNPSSVAENDFPLPPGNYAILVLNPSNGKVGAINLRMEYPECETERKILQSAYWAMDRTQNLFKGAATPINGGLEINLQLPTNIPIVYGSVTYTDGYCQLSHATHPISIGLVNDISYNAKFIPNSITGPQMADNGTTQFKLTRGNNNSHSVASMDIMAHEYGHAINRYGVDVIGSTTDSEAQAINEGFSDIIACIAEYTAKPAGSSNIWVMGDPLPSTIFKRDIANPISQNQPSYYGGPHWEPTEEESILYGYEYMRSRVFSYWFYLLVTNGSQTILGTTYTVPNIDGIGSTTETAMQKAAKIALAAFVSTNFDLHLPGKQNYCGLAQATLRAANALYPPNGNICSAELRAVKKAWQAVGVGSGTPTSNNPPSCLEPAGITCSLCTSPLPEIQLTAIPSCGEANNGQIELVLTTGSAQDYTYSWTGPNEYTSTEQNIYDLAAGTYTVTVTLSGNPDCSVTQSVEVGDGPPDSIIAGIPDATVITDPQPQISDIWPNPTQSEARLRYTLPAETTARFALYDLTGRLLQTATLSGNGQYSIAVGQYLAGVYLYEVLDAKSTLVLKRGKLLVVK